MAQLDPRGLQIVDPSSQHQAGESVHAEVHRSGRGRLGHSVLVQLGERMDKTQGDELREAAGPFLNVAQQHNVVGDVLGRLDVPVHNSRAAAQAELVCGRDDLHPSGYVHFLVAQDFAYLVVEDLGGGAGDRSESGISEDCEKLTIRHIGASRSVHDFHRRKRMDVQFWISLFDRYEKVAVEEAFGLRVDAPLHAHFAGAAIDRVLDFDEDVLDRMIVSGRIFAVHRERTELAADKADIGPINVAIDDVGNLVTDIFGSHQIGGADKRFEVVAFCVQQMNAVFKSQLDTRKSAIEDACCIWACGGEQLFERALV